MSVLQGLGRIKNHVSQALRLFTSHYQGKPNLEAITRSLVNRVQEFEEAIWDITMSRLLVYYSDPWTILPVNPGLDAIPWIGDESGELYPYDFVQNASGLQLDMLGRLVEVHRTPGESDASYLARIRIELSVLRSQGKDSDLFAIARAAMPGCIIEYFEDSVGPSHGMHARMYVTSNVFTDVIFNSQALRLAIHNARPAATSVELILSTSSTFLCCIWADSETPADFLNNQGNPNWPDETTPSFGGLWCDGEIT